MVNNILSKKVSPSRFLFYLLLLTLTPAHAAPDKLMPGVSDISLNQRPAQPFDPINNYDPSLTHSGIGQQFTVPVSRHHIIPFNVLRQFYNNVIQNPLHMLRIRSFFLSLSTNIPYYAPSGPYCVNHRSDLEGAMLLSECISHQLIFNGPGRPPAGVDTLQQFIAWIPGNLFIGPTNRSDDPGNRFEDNSEVVIGTGRFLFMRRLYTNMVQYNLNIADGHHFNNNELIPIIATDLSRLAQTRRVIQLNSANWVKDGTKYRLKKEFPKGDNNIIVNDEDEDISPECKSLKSHVEEVKQRKLELIFHDEL